MNDRQLEILDHYKNPRNFNKEGFISTHKHKSSNLTCGDEIEMQLVVNNSRIEDISFLGEGCSLCISSASMLSEYVVGKSVEEIKNIKEQEMLNIVGIEVTPAREKCILLGLEAMKGALDKP